MFKPREIQVWILAKSWRKICSSYGVKLKDAGNCKLGCWRLGSSVGHVHTILILFPQGEHVRSSVWWAWREIRPVPHLDPFRFSTQC